MVLRLVDSNLWSSLIRGYWRPNSEVFRAYHYIFTLGWTFFMENHFPMATCQRFFPKFRMMTSFYFIGKNRWATWKSLSRGHLPNDFSQWSKLLSWFGIFGKIVGRWPWESDFPWKKCSAWSEVTVDQTKNHDSKKYSSVSNFVYCIFKKMEYDIEKNLSISIKRTTN